MTKRTHPLTSGPVLAASLALLVACAAYADEIYKWVDKDGKTHYSSRKEDAENASTTTLHPSAAPPSDSSAPPSAASANEEIIRRGVNTIDSRYSPPVAVPKPVTRNYRSEAPADKCQLARDILSGAAVHDNGTEINDREREVAKSDIRTYCGK